jgi:uncharacterized spore protein YtfJ
MALRELAAGVTDTASVKRVFGQPIEKDGLTVIPVASVRGGFGGGEGPSAGTTEAGGQARPMSWGGGGAFSAVPAGVYVIKDGNLAWHPAVDQNRVIFLSMLTGVVGLLVVRSIVRTLAKRG